MKAVITALVSIWLLAACEVRFNSSPAQQVASDSGTVEDQEKARAAAEAFLNKVDSGRYEETWTDVSPELRKRSSQFAWTTMLKGVRGMLGKVDTRQSRAFGFTSTIEDLPVGRYAVFEFTGTVSDSTLFEKVVLQRVGERWMILGYFANKRYS